MEDKRRERRSKKKGRIEEVKILYLQGIDLRKA